MPGESVQFDTTQTGAARAGAARLLHRAIPRAFAIAMAIVFALALPACDRAPSYSQATPNDVIRSAAQMIKDNRAELLPNLLYAENDEMRRLYRALGTFMKHTQELAQALQAKFPEEVNKLKKQAEEAARKGQATTLFGQIAQAQSRARRGPPDKSQQDAFNAALKRIFVDPYGSLDDGVDHLSTTPINDDVVAIMVDGKPMLAPLGLTMRRVKPDGRETWAVVPPLNVPGVANFVPKTKEEFQIWGSLIKTIDNVVVDLSKDVKSGAMKSLDDVSKKAGEKVLAPAAMVMFAYSQAMESRKKAAQKSAQTTTQPGAPASPAPEKKPMPPGKN